MRIILRFICWPARLAVALLMLNPTAQAGAVQVGTGTAIINPPLGTPMAGYYHARGCQGVADDLLAKAAVLDDGRTRVAFVVCDLISLPRTVVEAARRQIEQQTGIPAANIMLSATHTHTGPSLVRDSTRDEPDGSTGNLAREYTQALPAHITRAVALALSNRAPAQVSFARETEHRLAFNRRFWMKDGTVGWNPGKRNPNIIRTVGPIDPELGLVFFESPQRQPLLAYVNFAMHPDTTGGTLASADYPGALARCLANYHGPEMLTLFANGTCGNLNHINVQWGGPQKGTNEANRLGTILAGAVLKAQMDLAPAMETTLRVRSQVVELPLAPVTEADLLAAREIVQRGPKAKFMEQVQAYKALDVEKRQGQPFPVEVQVVTLGSDLAWVSLPGEVFVELGLSIKAASPFKQTQLVELANGSIGYIPNRSAYAEGNYEVVSARCAAGSGERLVTAATTLLDELHREAVAAGK